MTDIKLTEAIAWLGTTDVVTASEVAAKIEELNLQGLAKRLIQVAASDVAQAR